MMMTEQLKTYLEATKEAFEPIRQQADEVMTRRFGNRVYVRGLIEFSNYCRCDCVYCGLRKSNKAVERYRLDHESILGCMKEAYDAGYRSFVLQSGEDPYYTEERLITLVKTAKQLGDIAITLSIGERPYTTYQVLKRCGVDRFLIKHECADETLYNRMHPHSSFEERIRCIKDLKRLGYQVGSGFMIGIPHQTTDTIVQDLQLLQGLNVEMAGIGPFIAHPDTPCGQEASGDSWLTLKAVALTRLLLPDSMLPVTTSLGIRDEAMKATCLRYGANVVMQKLQPAKFRRLYALYPKEDVSPAAILTEKDRLTAWLASCGKEAVYERGDYCVFGA